ncbi:hypothetical protein AGOR_G00235880 [Albula goreensis]|uniref:Ig-like domain-containing protein n=1 Tax=Albula goreensis TaxID=1534307 RepID=A0A8T3CL26_9TELE|nr:hypothetical protein AGOR_G00235880 [Albula goreensis]
MAAYIMILYAIVYQFGWTEETVVAAAGSITKVFELVSKPNITAECLRDNITLSCFSSQGSEVTYRWESLPPCGNDSCVHLGQTMEIHPLPPSESTSYVCAAQNPVSKATSDPVHLGVCSIPWPPGSTWVLILCSVTSVTFCLIGIIIIVCKIKKCEDYEKAKLEPSPQ